MAKKPERTIRLGRVSASVFVQKTGENGSEREFRTVNLQRSYREGEKTKYADNFTLGDLPAAIRCLQLAQRHVEGEDMGARAIAPHVDAESVDESVPF